nr:olfactory receptor 1A1-like [Meriones unguiculatus]
MREENESSTTDFTLLGVTRQQEQEYFFFILFLFIQPITVVGNTLIILAIHSDIRLHNPVCFFLANLSLVDIFFSSVTVPKMSANHLLGSNTISLQLSCSDIRFNVKMMYLGVGVFSVPLLCIIISYARVFSTVLLAPSTKSSLKALSTCGSHLTVVSLYYGTVMGMYFQPLTSYSLKHALITVMYTAVTPMLNPFIYSLRNQDMKAALRKLFHRTSSSSPM